MVDLNFVGKMKIDREFVESIDAFLILSRLSRNGWRKQIDLDFEIFETKQYTGRKG